MPFVLKALQNTSRVVIVISLNTNQLLSGIESVNLLLSIVSSA